MIAYNHIDQVKKSTANRDDQDQIVRNTVLQEAAIDLSGSRSQAQFQHCIGKDRALFH